MLLLLLGAVDYLLQWNDVLLHFVTKCNCNHVMGPAVDAGLDSETDVDCLHQCHDQLHSSSLLSAQQKISTVHLTKRQAGLTSRLGTICGGGNEVN
jgi:hypothetical protein